MLTKPGVAFLVLFVLGVTLSGSLVPFIVFLFTVRYLLSYLHNRRTAATTSQSQKALMVYNRPPKPKEEKPKRKERMAPQLAEKLKSRRIQ